MNVPPVNTQSANLPSVTVVGMPAPERPRARRRRRVAAALRCLAGNSRLPAVVAAGGGAVADRLLEIAREAGLQVAADADLAPIAARLNLGEAIPAEAALAVAAILLPLISPRSVRRRVEGMAVAYYGDGVPPMGRAEDAGDASAAGERR